MHGLVSYRRFGRVRSLRSNRTERTLGRYAAPERDVATERDGRSVATLPNGTDARSLRSDRTGRTLGRYVAIEIGSSSVAT
ncbi:hypothetical protein F2Q69_00047397 [Brassica cretica]|uniref:Uncharacterized protein n=1 Tax=Brassica cretica TaxID=69181 RepID=A0A8S9Q8H5_BRACR|nr:hypothetical protein F2Q69_00047397 [Brassica cretica]